MELIDRVALLPPELIRRVYDFVPVKLYLLDRRRAALRRIIEMNIYASTAKGFAQQDRLRIKYHDLTRRMWKYATNRHCWRCMRQRATEEELVRCQRCGRGQCDRQQHPTPCPWCSYHESYRIDQEINLELTGDRNKPLAHEHALGYAFAYKGYLYPEN